MSGSRDGERTLPLSNGTSMVFQRLSRTTTGSLIHLIFKETVDQTTYDALLPTQDGGNSLDSKTLM
jgi:hypothetical protein